MIELRERPGVNEQPAYIAWVLLFLFFLSILNFVIPGALYCGIYGVPRWGDLLKNNVVEYSHSIIWKDRVWHPVMRAEPLNMSLKAFLSSFDPEKGDVRESTELLVPWPVIGLVADQERLWVVSSNSVTLIEGSETTEIKPMRATTRTSEPFLYEGKLAVVDLFNPQKPSLLVFDEKEWIDQGTIEIPLNTLGMALIDLKIVSHAGGYQTFASDGTRIVQRDGLEFAPASALAPANGPPQEVSGSNSDQKLPEPWKEVYVSNSGLGTGGIGKFSSTNWRIGFVTGEPVVIVTSSTAGPNPFQGNSLLAFQQNGGKWERTSELKTQAIMSLMVVTDGERTYVGAESLAQTLKIHRYNAQEFKATGASLRAPVAPMQRPAENWNSLYQWVYWPSLLIMALVINSLMMTYRGAEYQFGHTNVELASITRRGIARVIDMLFYWVPSYGLLYAFGMSSQEQFAENMDQFFDFGPNGMLVRLAWYFLYLVLLSVTLLFINSWLQGIWGLTLGKWICGIRTVRSTLRPCGFLRALVRELMLVGDTFFASTYLPATLLIAFTSCRQRLGDLVADTIVIRKQKAEEPVF